jgi:hypothetical protein
LSEPQPPAEAQRELRVLIRRSSTLDAVLKRQWLRVLPHLKSQDLARLRSILAEDPELSADASHKGKRAPRG